MKNKKNPFVFLAFTTLAMSGNTFAEIQGQSFSHGDWELACDNTGTCRAAGYHSEDYDDDLVSVLLTRKAGANTPVQAEILFGSFEDAEEEKQYQMQMNGQDYGIVKNSLEHTSSLTKQQVQALLTGAKQNNEIIFKGEKRKFILSDRGMSAVLLKMDEFQKRVGTPSALIKKGNKSEQNVLKAEAIPLVIEQSAIKGKSIEYTLQSPQAKRIQVILKHSTNDDDCPILFGEEAFESSRLTITPLTQDKSLIMTPCWSGAYNFGSGAWVMDQKLTQVLQAVSESISDDETTQLYANHKGRGIGDCWSSETWVWNGQKFIQTYKAANLQCKGFAGGAWSMPTKVSEVKELARK